MAFVAYGVHVGVRVNKVEMLERLKSCLPPAWKPTASTRVDLLYSLILGGVGSRPGVRRFNLLYGNASRLLRSLDLDEVFDVFESSVHFQIAEAARRRLFVHAGVVGWQGRAILMPGRSHSGKSTLVAALVRSGATYYSDEYAVLDAKGRVHPYPRPLSLRDREAGKATRYRAEALGGTVGYRPLPVGLVVVCQYKPDAAWRPRRLSAGRGVLALLANTVSARRQPANALAMLQRVATQAVTVKGRRGEAKEVAPRLLNYLGKFCNHADIAR
jgi:hypothetical protein